MFIYFERGNENMLEIKLMQQLSLRMLYSNFAHTMLTSYCIFLSVTNGHDPDIKADTLLNNNNINNMDVSLNVFLRYQTYRYIPRRTL